MTEKLPFLLDSRLSLGTMHNSVSVERSVLLGTCLIKESAPSLLSFTLLFFLYWFWTFYWSSQRINCYHER